jgi:hypothetical protein
MIAEINRKQVLRAIGNGFLDGISSPICLIKAPSKGSRTRLKIVRFKSYDSDKVLIRGDFSRAIESSRSADRKQYGERRER